MRIYDISRSLTAETAAWPGDTPFTFQLKWKIADGASVNVGTITSSLHNGTHADAPFHFADVGATIDEMPLTAYLGAAVVIDLTSFSSDVVEIAHLHEARRDIEQTKRLLLKTNAWRDTNSFPAIIPVIAKDVPQWLGRLGVRLLGVDVPSVDTIDSKDLRNHHALAEARIAIVESLDLSAVSAGIYQLAALPLKIAGADAAPVRALLWQE